MVVLFVTSFFSLPFDISAHNTPPQSVPQTVFRRDHRAKWLKDTGWKLVIRPEGGGQEVTLSKG